MHAFPVNQFWTLQGWMAAFNSSGYLGGAQSVECHFNK